MSDRIITNIKKPITNYCANCVYPDSFARVLSFDEKEFVRVAQSQKKN